jgi:hypothetical protein
MVNYIPVLTTLLSVFFLSRIVPHYLAKRSPYLLWWSLGVLTFGPLASGWLSGRADPTAGHRARAS